MQNDMQTAFLKWKQTYQFSNLLEENEKLREYLYQLSKENENIQNEKNILELQTKKRNQISLNQIQPLRSSRRQGSKDHESRQNTNCTTNRSQTKHSYQLAQSIHSAYLPTNQTDSNTPIYERLHKDAYKKTQKQIINDVIKQHEELKDCTFKPNIQSNGSMSTGMLSNQVTTPSSQSARRTLPQQQQQREDPFLYDRLSKSTKKFNPELLQLQKENEEMKDCTFKPETNYKSKQLVAERNINDYLDKDQFFDRLYKEAETKDKFKKSLQAIKDHAEVNQCTFQPEILSHRNNSVILSARKSSSDRQQQQDQDAFTRLHQEYEQKQRSIVKIENEYEQKFKESHPFHPTRMTKQKDNKLCSRQQETSQQRAARMYDEWKERERKIQEKRDELLKEEQKLSQLTLQTNNRKVKRQRIDQDSQQHQQNSSQHNTVDNNNNTSSQYIMNTNQSSQSQLSHSTYERLYGQGKDKSRKQEELRDKLYKEQGYSFAPHTNNSSKYQIDKNVFDRNKEFIERKENHIREIQQQTTCEFKPQRVTAQSKLAKAYERDTENNNENLGDKLYQQMVVIEQKKEKQRQEYSVDKNCTFKPQLAKRTEKILRESSSNRTMNGSTLTKSSASIQSQQNNIENRQPFQVRNMNM